MSSVRWSMWLLLGCALALPPGARAETARYELDPAHTRVMFAVSHAGFSYAIGTVSGSSGVLLFDQGDWSTARLQASVPLTRLDLGDAESNRRVLADSLLDAADHPVATFISTRIEPIDAQHAAVFGMLTLRGVSKEVRLDVKLNAVKRHPLPPFRRTAGFSATTTFSRKAFGIDAWPTVIGDSIELRIEAEAVRARGPAGDDTDTDPSLPAGTLQAPAAEPVPPPEP